ncbi:MAG: galactose ABC transporter substrate-binding protein [Traorella sp.]
MKKIVALLMPLLLLLGLSACDNTDNEKKIVNVGVSIYKFDDNFMTLYRQEIESYLKGLSNEEVEYEVTVMDGKNDMAEQTSQIDNFIAQDYDVLIINLVQSTSASTIIDKCEAAKKPCIFINREPSAEDMKKYEGMITYVGADARQSGRMQGEIIANLDNKGDLNGDGILQYVMVVGDPENVDAKYRTQYSIEQYITSSGLKVEKLDEQRGDWDQAKGQEIVSNALTQYGDKIEVVFCNNDAMALGAAQAIKANSRVVGKDIYLVGVDALAEAVDLVSNKAMTGTVLNDHVTQARKAVDAAISAVSGKKLENYYWVDYVKVTPENAKDFK